MRAGVSSSIMEPQATTAYVERLWDEAIVPELMEYIRIPNKSAAFDPDWRERGLIDRVVGRFEAWARRQPIPGITVEVVRLEKRTPLILIDIPGAGGAPILLYGHLDKQPEMAGWRAGLDPWTPVVEGDRLYGRGAADDGYAMFAALGAIGALAAQKIPHARCVLLIEACEESGSFDLPAYIGHLAARIGNPELVIALDSGCGNYDQLWCTTSLRGLAGGTLTVEVLTEGVHSGDAGGVVPSSFRIARQLLSRIEDERTGAILLPEFHAKIPEARLAQARAAAAALGSSMYERFPFVDGAGPVTRDVAELILNRTWRPALEIVGADGLPEAGNAGNVLRPRTALKLSLRLPPEIDAKAASARLKAALESDPPHGARVTFKGNWAAGGWNAPPLAGWLERSLDEASRTFFGRPAAYMGEGGTIPFMAMLGERFPQAQFFITGVLGPHSNAHGPNEFLHIPTGKRLTACVARVIADHYRAQAG
jgi:acetylornithine deacetylase/succinyl-diaminopimelate desuccinylase-like protein